MLKEREARQRAEYNKCIEGWRADFLSLVGKWVVIDPQGRHHGEFPNLNEAKRCLSIMRKRHCGHLRIHA